MSNGQRWCSRCRKGKGRTPGENAQGENASPGDLKSGSEIITPADLGHAIRCPQCAVLLAEVAALRLLVPEMERLQLDQARLKQELSEARVRSGEMILMGSRSEGSPSGRSMEKVIPGAVAASQNANKHTMTPHGPHCQGVCCKYGRRAE